MGTVVVVLAATLIFSYLQLSVYQSRVEMLSESNTTGESVTETMWSSFLYDPDRFIQNQVKILQTSVLAKKVEQQLKEGYAQLAKEDHDAYIPESIPTAGELQSMITVQPGQKNSVFDIVITGGNPSLTHDVAQTYAEVYLKDRELASIAQISEARKEVWNRLTDMEKQLNTLANELKAYARGDVPVERSAAIDRVSNLYATLYQKYINLRIAESLQQRGLEIIQPAGQGGKISPKPVRNGMLSLFVGLILGIGLAFLVDYLDDTLRTREDFERYYDTTVVGEVPLIPGEELGEHHIIYFERSQLPAIESYRTLRTNLQFLNLENGRGLILFTSALPGEGKSSIMVNLGAALSETGKKVLLLGADLRKPVLDKFFDIASEGGLLKGLLGTCSLDDAICRTGYNNLDLLPAGGSPPNPGEMVASDEMRLILERVKSLYDYVLVDTPPCLATGDAAALAPMVDGVLMVGRYGTTTRESARRATEMMQRVDANILGLVINNIQSSKRYTYYHYYYFGTVQEGPGSRDKSSSKVSRRGKSRWAPPEKD